MKFPVNQRRVILLEARQKGEPLEFLRELIELARAAEWSSFGEESAICHLFLNSVKCDESKKICFKILRKNQEGDKKKLNYKFARICKTWIMWVGEKPKLFFYANPAPNAT